TGPDLFLKHDFASVQGAANLIANAQIAAGVEPLGLMGYAGLHDVKRDQNGVLVDEATPQAVDFYSPDTFNFNILQVSPDGKTLTVTAKGINSTAQNSAAEYGANGNTIRTLFSFQVDAFNQPPAVQPLSGPPLGVPGQELSFSAAFSDLEILETHTATFTWGDNTASAGVVNETNGAGTAAGSHVYTVPGVYTVSLTITDTAGASTTVTRQVTIAAANLQPDPLDPTRQALFIGGTTGDDHIQVQQHGNKGLLDVTIDGSGPKQ